MSGPTTRRTVKQEVGRKTHKGIAYVVFEQYDGETRDYVLEASLPKMPEGPFDTLRDARMVAHAYIDGYSAGVSGT